MLGTYRLLSCAFLSIFCFAGRQLLGQSTNGIWTQRGSRIGLVTFGPDVDSAAMGENNFVDGYVRKVGAKRFVYPVGGDGNFRPFAAVGQGTTGAYFNGDPGSEAAGSLFEEGPFSLLSREQGVGLVSDKEFWDIDGQVSTKITLSWGAGSGLTTMLAGQDLGKLTIVGWSAGKWVAIPSVIDATSLLGSTSSVAMGSITSSQNLVPDGFSVFTLGVVSEGSLPVVLASFDAKASEQSTLLTWKTAEEVNASHFVVQRSADGKVWEQIGALASKAETTGLNREDNFYQFIDRGPMQGTNLYRLKMVDLDLTYAYSQIKEVAFDHNTAVFLYPNPASDIIYWRGTKTNSLINAVLVDMSGKQLASSPDLSGGMPVSNVQQGIYVLTMRFSDGKTRSEKVFIKR